MPIIKPQIFVFRIEKDKDVRRQIRFNTVTKYIDHDGDRFTVRVTDLKTGTNHTESFDYVVAAVGHFSVPNIPHFDGIETFPGRVVHSHDFRDAREFEGHHILIVGAKFSANDIAIHLRNRGAKSITVSYRTKPTGLKWPDRIKEIPLLTRIDGKTVHFSDGSRADFDSIILCTGYQHNLNFLSDQLRLVDRNRFYPSGLYKGIFFSGNPRLMYLGMQDQAFTLTMFDAQAWYARDFILNRIVLPDKETQLKDIESWQKREETLAERVNFIQFQADYINDLIQSTNYPLNIYLHSDIFKSALRNRLDDFPSYRDKSFASALTNTLAAEALKITTIDGIDEIFSKDKQIFPLE